jgi:hypothetical protein
MESKSKRINVVILQSQYEVLMERGLNVSGLIRDLLGDHLSHTAITLQVSQDTRNLYDTIIANTGATDEDLEAPIRQALAELMQTKIEAMETLRQRLIAKTHEPTA